MGPAVDWVGGDTLEFALAPSTTLSMLVRMICVNSPSLAAAGAAIRYAVNHEYAVDETPLHEGDEVAIIPPVSGGSADRDARQSAETMPNRPGVSGDLVASPGTPSYSTDGLVVLTHDPIDTPTLVRRVMHSSCGAIVTFERVVRTERMTGASENQLTGLDYSAYHTMALRWMVRLRDEAKSMFGAHEIAVVHRLGGLTIGEASIAIVVAAPHRAAGFDACRHVLEAIKRDVPIWKREVWASGARTWVANQPGEEVVCERSVA